MNPDFTLIWPLSCPKDGDHFSHFEIATGCDRIVPYTPFQGVSRCSDPWMVERHQMKRRWVTLGVNESEGGSRCAIGGSDDGA